MRKPVFALVCAVAVSAVTCSQAQAQPTPVAIQFQINSYVNADQVRPSICTTPQGDFVVAFLDHYPFVPGGQSGQDGSGSTPCLKRFTAPATGGFELLANTYVTGDQTDIHAACAPNGDFLVSWNDRPNTEDGGRTAFVARAFEETSLPKANPFIVRGDELVGGPLRQTAICRGPDNSFFATWVDGDGSLFGRRYDVNGAAVGTEFPIASGAPANPACCGGDAGFVVAWADDTLADVSARRFSPTADALGEAFVVNTQTTAVQEQPDIACNDGGDFVVVWDSNAGGDAASGQDGSGHGIFGQAFDADGAPVGTEFRANSYTTGDQVEPRVSMDATGRFVAVWQSPQLAEGRHGIFGQTFTADAVALGSGFRADGSGANPQSSESAHPDVAMTTGGDFVVVWDNDQDEGHGKGIFGRLYDFPPSGPTTTVTTSTTVPGALVCGDPVDPGPLERVAAPPLAQITASDALFVLQTAVGGQTCELCVCDVDGGGSIVASDALLTLKKAVGQDVTFSCPLC
jgi:hypothetical protein